MRALTARYLVLIAALVTVTCSGAATPASPTPVPNVARVDVGVLGSAPAIVQPGQTLQLYALAADGAGTTTDATNLAKWSSADTAVAEVSAGGLVTGVAQGTVIMTATYGTASGTLATSVKILACAASTLSPPSRIFSPMGYVPCSDDDGQYGERITVTAAQSCNWSVATDVPWIGIDCYSRTPTYTPQLPGSGSFSYRPDPNNTPAARTGHLVVTFNDGARLVHTVTEEAPTCSYQVSPADVSLPKSGGAGTFDLTTAPANCQWAASGFSVLDADLTLSNMSGTGSQKITYQVVPNTKTFIRTFTIQITDPGRLNPSGRITIKQAAQ